MGFTLKYRETGSRGSFEAWGMGFSYQYNPEELVLDVRDSRKSKPLLYIDFDQPLSKNPFLYIETLEKTTQIKALMFSNNITNDLSEIFDDSRLVAILEEAARLGRYSFDLKQNKFYRFGHFFCEDLRLKRIQIKHISGIDPKDSFYVAKLKTEHDNVVSSRACTLHGVMKDLSDKTLRDLITAEFGHQFDGSAHNLLTVSSKLATISHILDERFVPLQKIKDTKPVSSAVEAQ